PEAAGMTAHKIELQLAKLRKLDVNVGEFSEASIDAINNTASGDDFFDDSSRFFRASACRGGEADLRLALCYARYLIKREPLSVKFQHDLRVVRSEKLRIICGFAARTVRKGAFPFNLTLYRGYASLFRGIASRDNSDYNGKAEPFRTVRRQSRKFDLITSKFRIATLGEGAISNFMKRTTQRLHQRMTDSSSKDSARSPVCLSGVSERSTFLNSPVTVPLRTRCLARRARMVVRRVLAVAACVHLRTVRKGRREN